MPHPHTNNVRIEPYLRIPSRQYYRFRPCASFANARSTEYEGLPAPRVGAVGPYVDILGTGMPSRSTDSQFVNRKGLEVMSGEYEQV
ncbi:hypothetical protein PISMIDRAFT_690582 [Pisolithus microcarpus 441]|uniref:Uncharacterized protein n=1 Tax=Pisolithus microcarpus 441 TaxID=765257 RepID=A0A0C9YAT9_9AGAM|nr:hypothetical protein PISMIDRAFT_690582 [Pisolithus microcarpus 441]